MIESRNTSRMSGIIGHSGHHSSTQDYRLLTTDPSRLSEDDLPGDLQSLSWLTSVDVPRLQQMATGRLELSSGPQSVLLGQHTAHLTASGGQTTIHLQSNIQNNLLGVSSLGTHNINMTHYSLNGESSPRFQSPATVYQASSQQVFTLAQTGQQYSSAGIYGSSSFTGQSQFSQTHLTSHGNQEIQPKSFPKPIYSYSCLIAMALKNSKTGSLPVSEIYSFMKEHFPYFKTAPDGWKNSVRHNLSLNKCFEKVENKLSGSSRKGCLWALNPAKIDKMEEEMQKWKRKDLPAIRRSMANPDELDKLITDRPESCRRKLCDGGVTRMSSCLAGLALPIQLQPQPVMTLSLQCLPLHHQPSAQARPAPSSPALAQTPPHHTPDMSHSPIAQHHGKLAHDYHNLHVDVSTEVDGLDPSIMDFALQGNLWEDMKDESFNLETLDAFSNSPLRLSDCELAVPSLTALSSEGSPSFSDLQVTGLYATYPAMESVSAQYMGAQGSSKPIALH
ncbi:forkhead box protein N4 [Paramormyrops kingsleyae]|uniref:forkhead box protein N4 n=1 Tax=Paramormyrops kingsleyae TaxID=1676925 RepID=UPI000CD669E5|nr:forkhead box protein N4 [Paramormyrops kingsleyae]XP_023689148.1 forkhead box protein N4 [Paramormyrops kingsleyae]